MTAKYIVKVVIKLFKTSEKLFLGECNIFLSYFLYIHHDFGSKFLKYAIFMPEKQIIFRVDFSSKI